MGAQYCGQQTVMREALPKSGSFEDRPQKTQHIGACPRTLTRQQTGENREMTKLAAELPSPRSPTNFIYTTFASYVAWLLQLIFRWRSNASLDQENNTPSSRPDQPEAPAQEVKKLHTQGLSPPPGMATAHDPGQDWRLQILMERRKREVEHAQRNRNIVVTFSGPAQVDVGLSVEKNTENLSEDEDGCRLPLPFSSSDPVSLRGTTVPRYCPLSTEKHAPAFFDSDCPGPMLSRSASPCPSDVTWVDSEFDAEHTSTSASSDRPTRSRCSSPIGWEDMNGDESDEELRECTAVISVIFEQD